MIKLKHMSIYEQSEMLRLAMQQYPVAEIAQKIGRSREAVYNQLKARDIPSNPVYRNPTQIFNMIPTGYVKPPYSQKTFKTLLATVDIMIEDMTDVKQNLVWAIEQTETLKEVE